MDLLKRKVSTPQREYHIMFVPTSTFHFWRRRERVNQEMLSRGVNMKYSCWRNFLLWKRDSTTLFFFSDRKIGCWNCYQHTTASLAEQRIITAIMVSSRLWNDTFFMSFYPLYLNKESSRFSCITDGVKVFSLLMKSKTGKWTFFPLF